MDVLAKVQRYLKATGVPPTVFGRRAINDPRLVGDLRNGRELRATTRARVEAYIAGHPNPCPSAGRGRPCGGGRTPRR